MSETGYVIDPICGEQPTSDQMWSDFLWMMIVMMLFFGKDGKPTEEEKEDKKDGQQPVQTESNE